MVYWVFGLDGTSGQTNLSKNTILDDEKMTLDKQLESTFHLVYSDSWPYGYKGQSIMH